MVNRDCCRKQVKTLGKFFAMSFSWGFFQWFYSAGEGCGFKAFPTLGLEAYKQKYSSISLIGEMLADLHTFE